MTLISTTAAHPHKGLPVRKLRVEVLEGPDQGATQVELECLTIGSGEGNSLRLTDPTVSKYHLELKRGSGGILVMDCGSTNGVRVGDLLIDRATVPAGTELKLGKSTLRINDGENGSVDLHKGGNLAGLHGQTPSMRRLFAKVEKAAQSEVSVLVIGETGTGKERIAEAVHELSSRTKAPFITVDCGSLMPTLVASELFGHERGAFTGADRQHEGAFERAHKGTLFLDEIGELPTSLQTSLLGVLERGRFRRLGGSNEIAVDVRVVCATNRDLRAEVNAGRFRLDLYHRLAVVTLSVPPLRERRDDIAMLAEHFLRSCGFTEPLKEVLPAAALDMMAAHHWPGNVRELRNFIEATLAMGEAPEIPDSLPSSGDTVSGPDLVKGVLDESYKQARKIVVADFEKRFLAHLLERCEDNVSLAARTADIDRSHLSDLLKRHKLR